MEELKTIEVKVIASSKLTKDGKQFISFKAVQKNGNLITCKFRKSCKNIPECTGSYILVIDKEKCNLNLNKEWPEFWIEEIVEVKKFENKSSAIDEIF